MSMSETNEELSDLDLNDSVSSPTSKKYPYKDRKLEHRLNKYEAIIKKQDNINRVYGDSQFLFVGNGGLDNNISADFLEEKLSPFGKIVDTVMQIKKSYSFVIYEDPKSAQKAIEALQAQVITTVNQTDICFYLFAVDKVPESAVSKAEFEEVNHLPEGLIYLENYITESYADRIIEILSVKDENQNAVVDLKRRKVKHFGYEFRYGSNNCDDTKPLTDPENKMPEILNELFNKMLQDKIINVVPDQLTVNYYEPGHGIGPHIDNTVAFDEYIISLSLMSSAIIEFRQKETKKLSKQLLKPNSLLVLKGESRYIWNHSIPERKHDLIQNSNGQTIVQKRQKRISLTFRKIVPVDKQKKLTDKTEEPEMIIPQNDFEARNFEKYYVQSIYNEIADHFSQTRHSPWPGVTKFINSMDPYSFMLDIGCGNGKYLNLRQDLFAFGCDFSEQLIRICQERNFKCFVSDCLSVPGKTDFFDYSISIAVIHHLSTEERRIKAINEMKRILRPGGRGLITVWAKEQKYKEKESFYISKKSADGKKENLTETKTESSEPSCEDKKDTNVHTFGKEFQKKDVFVAWRLNEKAAGKKVKNEQDQRVSESQNDQKSSESKVYLRFYHVFENNELESLFEKIPGTKIVESFYEQGNWCVIFEKLKSE